MTGKRSTISCAEAFACCREASRRTIGLRHYDVQLIGGMVLHQGKIAEMKTGEGKTLVATLAVYLNALSGQGVHVVTVNDYLARRDAEWMGPIYRFLGLTVGVIQHDMPDPDRKAAYQADITYGTNNEFGFDYLRDNMKYSLEECVQRGHNFAIVDEVDSILIDEARTPLIISGPSEESTDKYYKVDKLLPRLRRDEDYAIDEKARTVVLQESGIEKAEQFLGDRQPLRPQELRHGAPHPTGLEGARALQTGRGLHGEGRPGRHRGRVHRAPDAGTPLFGRVTPGSGGEGRRQDRAREPDARDHHVPELLPDVQEAGRHDRYSRNRSG